MIDISIIIVTYNSVAEIGACLQSILTTQDSLNIEVYVVDNNSKDDTVHLIEEKFSNVKVIKNNINAGFTIANNQAINFASGKYILLLNPDTVVKPNALQEMISFMANNQNCGICGPNLIDEFGNQARDLRFTGILRLLMVILQIHFLERRHLKPKKQKALSGACLLIPKRIIEIVGLLDEKLFWCEDIDYCLRVKKSGYDICRVSNAEVLHLQGRSTVSNLALMLEKQTVSKMLVIQKHGTYMQKLITPILFKILARERFVKYLIIGLFRNNENIRIRKEAFKKLPKKINEINSTNSYLK